MKKTLFLLMLAMAQFHGVVASDDEGEDGYFEAEASSSTSGSGSEAGALSSLADEQWKRLAEILVGRHKDIFAKSGAVKELGTLFSSVSSIIDPESSYYNPAGDIDDLQSKVAELVQNDVLPDEFKNFAQDLLAILLEGDVKGDIAKQGEFNELYGNFIDAEKAFSNAYNELMQREQENINQNPQQWLDEVVGILQNLELAEWIKWVRGRELDEGTLKDFGRIADLFADAAQKARLSGSKKNAVDSGIAFIRSGFKNPFDWGVFYGQYMAAPAAASAGQQRQGTASSSQRLAEMSDAELDAVYKRAARNVKAIKDDKDLLARVASMAEEGSKKAQDIIKYVQTAASDLPVSQLVKQKPALVAQEAAQRAQATQPSAAAVQQRVAAQRSRATQPSAAAVQQQRVTGSAVAAMSDAELDSVYKRAARNVKAIKDDKNLLARVASMAAKGSKKAQDIMKYVQSAK